MDYNCSNNKNKIFKINIKQNFKIKINIKMNNINKRKQKILINKINYFNKIPLRIAIKFIVHWIRIFNFQNEIINLRK